MVGYLGGGGVGDGSRVDEEISSVEDDEVGVSNDIDIDRDEASESAGR